jgi:glucose-1-phosphate cytidylyltransferase
VPRLRRAPHQAVLPGLPGSASNDFVLQGGRVELRSSDVADWSITVVDTGFESSIGEWLRRVRRLLEGEEMFLANYADVLTVAPIDAMVAQFAATPDAVGQLLAVPPQAAFHVVEVDDGNHIKTITALNDMRLQENGGHLVPRQEVFDYLPENGDLIADACAVLANEGRLAAYPYHGFWHPADTLKERVALAAMYQAGDMPWMQWRTDRSKLPQRRCPCRCWVRRCAEGGRRDGSRLAGADQQEPARLGLRHRREQVRSPSASPTLTIRRRRLRGKPQLLGRCTRWVATGLRRTAQSPRRAGPAVQGAGGRRD